MPVGICLPVLVQQPVIKGIVGIVLHGAPHILDGLSVVVHAVLCHAAEIVPSAVAGIARHSTQHVHGLGELPGLYIMNRLANIGTVAGRFTGLIRTIGVLLATKAKEVLESESVTPALATLLTEAAI